MRQQGPTSRLLTLRLLAQGLDSIVSTPVSQCSPFFDPMHSLKNYLYFSLLMTLCGTPLHTTALASRVRTVVYVVQTREGFSVSVLGFEWPGDCDHIFLCYSLELVYDWWSNLGVIFSAPTHSSRIVVERKSFFTKSSATLLYSPGKKKSVDWHDRTVPYPRHAVAVGSQMCHTRERKGNVCMEEVIWIYLK